MRKRNRRRVPQLNTTSTADISFMLLILFLVTTSMDVDKGLSRRLPPNEPPRQEHHQTDIDRRDVLSLRITADNRLLCNDVPMPLQQVHKRVEAFITERGKRHVIEVEADRNARYDTYFTLQNELVAVYNDLRNRLSKKRYGRAFALLDEDRQETIRHDVPQRISERYLQKEGGHP